MAFNCKHTLALACFLLILLKVSFARLIVKDDDVEEKKFSQKNSESGNVMVSYSFPNTNVWNI